MGQSLICEIVHGSRFQLDLDRWVRVRSDAGKDEMDLEAAALGDRAGPFQRERVVA